MITLLLASGIGVSSTAPRPASAARDGFPGRNGLIAFERRSALYTVRADGSHVRRLTREYAAGPAWSPDGARLLFYGGGSRSNDQLLLTMRADGSGKRKLRVSAIDTTGAAWAPDGRRLVLSRLEGGYQDMSPLYVVTPSTRQWRRITRSRPAPNGHYDSEPAWSPDGGLICFARQPFQGSTKTLYLVRPSGGGARELTEGDEPDWAPDGRAIVFVDDGDLYTVAADGTRRRALTRTRAAEASPEWSPDGRRIAFVRGARNGYGGALWIFDLASRRAKKVVGNVDAEVDWQPIRR